MDILLYRLATMAQKWELICPEEKKEVLTSKVVSSRKQLVR